MCITISRAYFYSWSVKCNKSFDFVAITFIAAEARILRWVDISPRHWSHSQFYCRSIAYSSAARLEFLLYQSNPPTTGEMESWLGEVKQLRIPRPKFGVGQVRAGGCCPIEPPRDYYTNEDYSNSSTSSSSSSSSVAPRKAGAVAAETEKMRQSLQQNLWAEMSPVFIVHTKHRCSFHLLLFRDYVLHATSSSSSSVLPCIKPITHSCRM